MKRGSLRSFAALAVAAIALIPLVVMILGSIRPPGLPPSDGLPILPETLSFDTYRFVNAFVPLWRYSANSLLVVTIAVPVTVLLASLAGFAIATASRRRARLLVGATLVAMLVPSVALWVPRFVMLRWLGLGDTLWAVIMAGLIAPLPLYVLIFAFAYARVPRDIYEAARLDGWSSFGVWRRVAFPLARPAAFAVAVLAAVVHWSNFVDPLLYLSDPVGFTLPLGLRALQTLEPANFPLLLAGAVVATVPPVLFFLFVQRALFTKTLEAR